MSKYFGKQQLNGTIKALPGIGSTIISVPFIPDYIKVDLQEPATMESATFSGMDDVYWDMSKVDAKSYELTIAWSVYDTRLIKYQVAKLTVDPV